MMERFRTPLVAMVAALVLFFRLGDARLWDRDEPRNARCAVEMLERNDWVVPMFNGELRTHKPALVYWLIMSAYAVFGENEFAARFWSAVFGVGTVLCTYALGRKLYGERTGIWSAVCLIPALMFNTASRAATPDASLIFFVTASLTAFACLRRKEASEPLGALPKTTFSWLGIYALTALAVLAKGPVGFVLPVGIMGASTLLTLSAADQGHWKQRLALGLSPVRWGKAIWSFRPWWCAAAIGLIAIPWYVWVGLRTDGEFLLGFLWEHNVRRATESMEGHRGSAIFFYPMAILAGFFPASIFAIPTLSHTWKTLRKAAQPAVAEATIFLVTWVTIVVVIFSLAGTKLPSYVTPCYPALAVLTGYFLARWEAGTSPIADWWPRVSFAVLTLVGVGATIGISILAERLLPGEQQLAWIGLALIIGGVCGWIFAAHRRTAALTAFAISATIFTASLFGFGAAAADRHQLNGVLFATAMQRTDQPEFAAWRCLEPSWVFYRRARIHEIKEDISPELEARKAVAFIEGGKLSRFLIIKRRDYAAVASLLPDGYGVIAETPLFLKPETLLLVGKLDEKADLADAETTTRR